MNTTPQMTFVCCVESGGLESQTIRLVKSLRRHGGKFAAAPILAVTCRFGPPLSRSTLRFFEKEGVVYIRRPIPTPYSWFNFMNKPLALVTADGLADTEAMCFLDGDLLFVGEPDQLELAQSVDFLGFPVEEKEMGTMGPGDAYEPLWQAFCRVAGIDIGDLPWITTAEMNQRVRLYFNSGIFVYRRSSGFSKAYRDICLQLLDSRIGTAAPGFGEGIREMIAVGFAVIKLGLRWRPLPYSHDYSMMSLTHKAWYKEDWLREARVIHYHDSMWPPFFPIFQDCLRKTHPEVEAWLGDMGPMYNVSPAHWRILARILRRMRAKQAAKYRRSCVIV